MALRAALTPRTIAPFQSLAGEIGRNARYAAHLLVEGPTPMMLIPTYVAPSKIEGVGVFAAEDIPLGMRIWELAPGLDRLIRKDEIASLPLSLQAFVERYSYPYPHDPDRLIVELDNGRFMNHSEHPNTRFDDPDAGFALRNIQAGEELTCDYAEFDPSFEILPGRLFVSDEA